MYHFFVEREQIGEGVITILGADVNHIKNVLRMRCGETILISDVTGMEYTCEVSDIASEQVVARIVDVQNNSHELPVEVILYQGLPKADKMELIIQKNVELGASKIVPVVMKRSIVKIDSKKEEAKIKRWNAISESAAKQSKRSIIPEVTRVLNYKQAIEEASLLDVILLPYELAEGMEGTRRVLSSIQPRSRVGIFIGPEGGFEESEIQQALAVGAEVITLGRRILRTETAGIAALAMLTYELE